MLQSDVPQDHANSEFVGDLEQSFPNQHLNDNGAATPLVDLQDSTLQFGEANSNFWETQIFDPSLPISVPFANPFSLEHQGTPSSRECFH